MSLLISDRGLATPASPIRKLAPYAAQAKAKGKKVYHLNIGQPDIETPSEFFQAVHNYNQTVIAYNPSNGIQPLLNSLKGYYNRAGMRHIEENDIMVTTGGSEAIVFSMMTVTSPGDEIIVFEPFYPNYNGFAAMSGVKLVPVASDPETGYALPSRDQIEAKITGKTKAILICTPNNPTGTILTEKEMSVIKEIALKHDLYVLSDEVYREFAFEGAVTSILSFPELQEHAICMDSMSKRYSVCGARIGCIVSKNKAVMETALKFGQARLCPPTLEQVGSEALVREGDKYFSDMISEYKKRRDILHAHLTSIEGVFCLKPTGAFYMMVTFPVQDIEHFAQWLLSDYDLNNETTMIAPGPGFYASPGKGMREARIAYVLNCDELIKAAAVFKEGLKAYPHRI